MSKQIHIRLDDAVYDAITRYTDGCHISMQDAVSTALMQFLTREMRDTVPDTAAFSFIDLFAGIGGMRIAYEKAGGHCVYSNEWNKYNDSIVSPVQNFKTEVIDYAMPYLLFYQKIN